MIRLSEGDAPYTIHAELTRVGDDLLCIVTGGTRPHIGAVCLADFATGQPVCRTLAGEGHKEALPAELFAKALCEHHGVNVACTAGIHVDDASTDEIGIMMGNATMLLDRLLKVKV
ncbi:MAG: hypothetical protein LBN12_07295 [Clostridiales Family XIII bacterium]|nr:hypothetical protein [Clostridiales Family XIII bacterium]